MVLVPRVPVVLVPRVLVVLAPRVAVVAAVISTLFVVESSPPKEVIYK